MPLPAWFPFRGTRPVGAPRRWAEHQRFPEVEVLRPSAGVEVSRMRRYHPCTACDLALDDGTVYALFGGFTDDSRRMVDTFALQDGAYAGSYRLPARALRVDVEGGTFYVLVRDPVPVLLALRPRPG